MSCGYASWCSVGPGSVVITPLCSARSSPRTGGGGGGDYNNRINQFTISLSWVRPTNHSAAISKYLAMTKCHVPGVRGQLRMIRNHHILICTLTPSRANTHSETGSVVPANTNQLSCITTVGEEREENIIIQSRVMADDKDRYII